MDFYERVKDLVKSSGKTIREFIEELNINYDSYNSLKRYNNLPRADECVKIARKLDVSVEYLVTGEDKELLSDEENDFLQLYRKVPKMYKHMAKSVLKQFSEADDPGDNFITFDLTSSE